MSAQRKKLKPLAGEKAEKVCLAAVYARTSLDEACAIIETGDQRLLASDGPAGGRPPALTLAEWRKLYVLLDRARKRAWKVAPITGEFFSEAR